MRQVLFYIPLQWLAEILPESLAQYIPEHLPLYGYGMMLFIAFVLCSWLAGRLARREGIDPKILPDLAIWLFVTGILGARITFVMQEWPSFADNPRRVFYLWDGGLVLYGSIIGGAIGYVFAHRRFLAPEGISAWKMADVLAPSIALGVGLGRIGCLLTGCCFGNVACPGCLGFEFPLPSAPTIEMARLGYQTLTGFTVDDSTLEVRQVEPQSPAAAAGLEPGDMIVRANDLDVSKDRIEKAKDGKEMIIARAALLHTALANRASPGTDPLRLTVVRDGHELALVYTPWSLPLHPTQVYETISMGLLLFLLLAYYPLKQRDGSVMVLLMVGYGVHRFLNEMLRIDNPEVVLGMTFSQLVSVGVLLGAAVLAYLVFVRGVSETLPQAPAVSTW